MIGLESIPFVISWKRLITGEAGDEEAVRVRAARRGDRRAFDSLVHAYERPLRGFLVRRVGFEAADDVLQETWLAAWHAMPNFAARSRFKAWLFGIALHKATDARRAQGRTQAEAWSDMAENQIPAGRDPFADADLKHSVQAVLVQILPVQREVLELYYYADLTLPEIAESLGRNLNTVKYQFYRAHAQAADGLREYAPTARGEAS